MVLKKIWTSWKALAKKIARVQTIVLVFLSYWLIMVPLGALARLFGWDPLDRKLFRNSTVSSNWREFTDQHPDLESLRHQS